MDAADLRNRFQYHPPRDDLVAARHESVRESVYGLAVLIDNGCPDSREKSLAITKLEEAMFWSNAAIARNQE